jgi:hypothetical protein
MVVMFNPTKQLMDEQRLVGWGWGTGVVHTCVCVCLLCCALCYHRSPVIHLNYAISLLNNDLIDEAKEQVKAFAGAFNSLDEHERKVVSLFVRVCLSDLCVYFMCCVHHMLLFFFFFFSCVLWCGCGCRTRSLSS